MIRFVPDSPATWLVYDLGDLVLALPTAYRAAADAVAALPRRDAIGTVSALEASGIASGAPFAIVASVDGGLRIALRGPATVAVGAVSVTGLGADSWLDHRVDGESVARLTVPGGEWTLTFGAAPAAVAPAPAPAAPARAAAAPAVAATALVAPAALGLRDEITAVPGQLESSAPAGPPRLLPEPAAASESDDEDGATVLAADLADELAASGGDRTVVVDEVARLRAKRAAGPAAPTPAPAVDVPLLSLGLPDGSRQPLDALVVIGRAPAAPADGTPARLVRLEGDGDISRTHARVAVEGGTVVVTDLGSRNGTVVRVPGRPAQRLRDGEPTPVLVGTVIDLGGGVELSVLEG